jgi:O-antigen ligase
MRLPESSIAGPRQAPPPGPQRHSALIKTAPGSTEGLGFVYPLLLVWLVFEFGRPPNPFGIPLLISIVSLIAWVTTKDKQVGRTLVWWLVLLGVMGVGIVAAPNTYAAFWTAKGMAVLFLTICLPLQAQITSVRRVRLWIYSFLAVAGVVGVWAAAHGGYGPSGAGGGQDENYVAALMGMSIGLAYFSLFAEKRRLPKLMLGLSMLVSVAAIAGAGNPSRGGFIGLCAVGAYCIARSPRKMLGFGLLSLVGVALLALAGPAFWAEIATSTDYQSGTGDIRLEIWKAGLRMWEANPIFGVGAGNFKWVIGDYQSAAQLVKFGRSLGGTIIAHSSHVEMLAELGAAGALATGMLVWRTWTSLGPLRPTHPGVAGPRSSSAELDTLGCYADAIRAAIIAVLVNGVFLSLFYYSHLWLLLAVGGSLPFVAGRIQSGGGREAEGDHWRGDSSSAPVSAGRSSTVGAPGRRSTSASR